MEVYMTGVEVLLEHISKLKKDYEDLEVCGGSSELDLLRKISKSEIIMDYQSKIIEKLLEISQ